MCNIWDTGTGQNVGPVRASLFEHVDINDAGGWNSELPQRPKNCMNRLLILCIDKQAVWK
jgi:hypothetical protein